MIDKIQSTIRKIPQSIILYLVFVILMMIVISSKMNYYIDEIYSYGLANSTGEGIDMTIEYDKTYAPAGTAYSDYMVVQKGEQFSYDHVWQNQTNDVHPPLYYALLHTISSIFPDTFSRWFAGGINIIFAVLVLFVVRKLIPQLTDSRYLMEIISGAFVCLSGVLLAVSYMRMYIMAMFWVTLLTYLFVKQVGDNDAGHIDKKFLICIYLTTVAGALTHYYVIVFVVCLSIVYGLYLLCYKRIRELVAFVITMLLAGGTSIAIFPAMISHIFFGYRGEEALSNLADNAGYKDNLDGFFELINNQLFGSLLKPILVCLVLTVVFRYAKNHVGVLEELQIERISFGFSRELLVKYGLIFIPSICYFLIIARSAFVVADRYMFPIYAVIFVGIMCMVYHLLRRVLERKEFLVVTMLLTALIICGSNENTAWTNLYKDTQSLLTNAYNHRDYDCVCVFGGDNWMLYPSFAEYSNYKSITFITSDELKEDGISKWLSSDGIVVSFLMYDGDVEEALQTIMSDDQFSNQEELGTFGFDRSYFLSR